MLPWKIKICGITNPADAQAASECGADALGLNFYSRSLRSVSSGKSRLDYSGHSCPGFTDRCVRQRIDRGD